MPRASVAVPPLIRVFKNGRTAGVFVKRGEQGLTEYDELKGIDGRWQGKDGAMTKAPLGGGTDTRLAESDSTNSDTVEKKWNTARDDCPGLALSSPVATRMFRDRLSAGVFHPLTREVSP